MSPRLWRVGAGIAAAVILVAAWLLVVSPKRQQVAELTASTVDQQVAADQLRAKISLLKKMGEEVPAQEAQLAAIQQRMPTTMSLPSLIRQLSSVASRAGVQLAGITPGRPSDVSGATTSSPDQGSTSTSGRAAGGAPAAAPATPAATGEGAAASSTTRLRAATISIRVCGSFAQLRTYLQGIESMRRVVAVSAVDITRGACTAAAGADDLTAALTAHAFTVAPGDSPSEDADD